MNIFAVDSDPIIAAQMQCDKHVVKMTLESAQMLSTAHRLLDGKMHYDVSKTGRKVRRYVLTNANDILYKAVHQNHPCTVWTMESKANYDWHYRHFIALSEEYTYRYGKVHLCDQKLRNILNASPKNIPDIGLTPFKLAMAQFPECIVKDDPIESYKNYYATKVANVDMRWTKRDAPEWFTKRIETKSKKLLTSA